MTATTDRNTASLVAGLFNVVAADDIPTKIRRSRGDSQWAEAIMALRGLETGQALSLTVFGEKARNNTRQNMIQANKAHGQGMRLLTRTSQTENVDENGEPEFKLFFIKGDEAESDD